MEMSELKTRRALVDFVRALIHDATVNDAQGTEAAEEEDRARARYHQGRAESLRFAAAEIGRILDGGRCPAAAPRPCVTARQRGAAERAGRPRKISVEATSGTEDGGAFREGAPCSE